MPAPAPASAPAAPMASASIRNSARIFERRTPTAIMVPISRVRSITLISIVFATPRNMSSMNA